MGFCVFLQENGKRLAFNKQIYMNERYKKPLEYLRKMSPLKKVLIVFVILLIFIIVVEQPGSDTSRDRKGAKFFMPKMAIEEVQKISIQNPAKEKPVLLEKKDSQWRVTNGHLFPVDTTKLDDFLKALFNLEQGSLVSKNKDRTAIFSVDEKTGIHVQIWDIKNQTVGDFYAGQTIPDGQYMRRSDSFEVYQTIPSLTKFLLEDIEGWKDKTLLTVKEEEIKQVVLQNPNSEITLEKGTTGVWEVVKPEKYGADNLAIRTLFDQLKLIQGDTFVDSIEGSQANFEKPDYKISVRKIDNSSSSVLFTKSDKDKIYYAKYIGKDFIYSVSSTLIDNIFGLKFKSNGGSN